MISRNQNNQIFEGWKLVRVKHCSSVPFLIIIIIMHINESLNYRMTPINLFLIGSLLLQFLFDGLRDLFLL